MSSENNNIRNLYVGLSVFCLVATLVYLLNSLGNVIVAGSDDEGAAEHFAAATDERIKPVAEVNAGDTSIVVVRSAKEIVAGTCASCHSTGVLGAPKIGAKSAWKARMTNGLEGLVKTAINGKGSMPARGGDSNLTDADVKKAVQYMLKESGL